MKDGHVSESDLILLEQLNSNPHVKERVKSALSMIENADGTLIKASDAEQRAIEEMRKLGQEVLQSWANKRVTASSEQVKTEISGVTRNGKKSS